MNIELDPAKWQPTGPSNDPGARLLWGDGHIVGLGINGCYCHVEAYAVFNDEDGEQVAVDMEYLAEVDAIQVLSGSALATQRINGRDYIVVVYPHGN